MIIAYVYGNSLRRTMDVTTKELFKKYKDKGSALKIDDKICDQISDAVVTGYCIMHEVSSMCKQICAPQLGKLHQKPSNF